MKKNKIITTGMKMMRYYLQYFIVVLLLVCYSNVSKSQNGVNAFTVNDPCTNCIGTAQNALYSFPVVISFNWTNNTTSATVTLGYDNTKVNFDNFNLSSLPSCISVNYATPGVLTVKMLNLSSCPSPTGAISFQVYFRFICRDSCANDIKTADFKGTLTDNFNNTLTSNCSIDGQYISNWIFNHAWYSYNASTAEITYKVDFTNQSCVIVKNPKFNVTLSPCSGTITSAWGTEDSNNDGIPDYTYTVSGGTTITPNSTAYLLYAHDVMYYVVKLNCGTCINQTLISDIKLTGDNCNIPNSTIVIATPPVSFPIPSPAATPSASLVKSVSTSPSPHFVSVITNTGNTALNLIMEDFLPSVHASSIIQRSNQIGLNNTANYYDCNGTMGSSNILLTASGNNGTPALTNLPVNTKKIKYSINNLLPNSWVKLEVYFDLTSSCSAGTPPYKDSCSVSYNCTAPAVTCMPCGTGTGTKTGVVVYNPQPILSCISHSNYNSSCKKVGDILNFCFTFKNTGDAPMPAGGIFTAPMPNWLQRIPNSETFTGFTSNPTYLSGNAKWTLPAIAIGSTVSLCFNTVINAGATGQATVTPTVSVGNKNYDIIGSGDCQIIINICAFAAIGIDKKVKGSLDGIYGASGNGVAGSLVNYEITLHNTGSSAIDNLEVIDRIPSSGDLTILGNPNSTSRGSQFNLLMGLPLPIIPNCTVSYSSIPNACTGWSGVGLNCGLPLVPTWSPTPGGAKNIHFLFNPSVTMAPGDIKTFNFQLQIPAGTPTGLLACNSAGFIAKPVNAAFTINPVESPIVCVEIKSGGVQPQQGCCHDVMKKIQVNQNVENNTLVVNANMSVGPAKIKSAFVSLVDFHVMHPKECDVCVKDPKLMGNIVNPSGAGNWSYVPQGVSYSHSIEWKDNIGKDWSSGIPLHFEIPLSPKNPDSNCCDTISYCLKYSFTDTACITCDTIICYQVIIGTCGGGGSTGCSCNFKPVFNYSLDDYRIGRDGHKYVIHGITQSSNVSCGGVINLSAGNFSTTVTPNFECKDKSGKDCRGAVLNVTIKKPDNTVQILAGTSYSYSFASPGTYQYTISAICDGKKCECTFTVVIAVDTASCECEKWIGSYIKYQSADMPTAKLDSVICSDNVTLPIGKYTFTAPDYNCNDSSCITYTWTITGPHNYTMPLTGKNISLDFSFYPGTVFGLGTTVIKITIKCGNKVCGLCNFNVVIVNKTGTTGNGTGTQVLSPTFANPTTSLKPTFTWTDASNAKDLFYRILLAKLDPEQFQNPESGLKNKAIVNKAGISNTSFAYPANAPLLEKGQVYVWGIQAYKKGMELNSSELPTVVGVFVPDPPSPPEAMPCSDCPFGCDGACIRDQTVLSGCWCLPFLHPEANKIAVKVVSDTSKEIAFSWKTDYYVENKDILGYLGTKKLIIKKGVYKFNYSKNPYGDVILPLVVPIPDNGIEKREIMFEGIPANADCCADGSSCIGNPCSTMKENPSLYTVKPVLENGFVNQIILSYKGKRNSLPNANDTIATFRIIGSEVCHYRNGIKYCYATYFTCAQLQPYQPSGWTCKDYKILYTPLDGRLSLNREKEGRASFTIDGEKIPISSDAFESFLLSMQKLGTTLKMDDTQLKKEFETFIEKDKGVVSDNRLKEISKKQGIPITVLEK